MMADVTRTDNINRSRAGDIKKTRNVAPVKKVVKKRSRLNVRERPSKKDRNGNDSDNPPKEHIDVYA